MGASFYGKYDRSSGNSLIRIKKNGKEIKKQKKTFYVLGVTF
jgi:hypothetical protein